MSKTLKKMAPAHRVDTEGEWVRTIQRLQESDEHRGRCFALPSFVSLDMVNAWSALGASGAFNLVAMEMIRIGLDGRLTPERRAAVQAAFAELAKRVIRTNMFERVERVERA